MTRNVITRRRFLAATVAGGVAAATAGRPRAAAAQRRLPLKLGYILGTPIPIMFAGKEQGFFETPEMTVELLPFAGGAPATEALVSGSIHIAQASPIVHLYLLQRGFDLVAITAIHEDGPLVRHERALAVPRARPRRLLVRAAGRADPERRGLPRQDRLRRQHLRLLAGRLLEEDAQGPWPELGA
jgi:hypothetical protein